MSCIELVEEVAKPLKIKKGENVKKIDFQDSPTAWLVYPSQDLYSDPKTRTSDNYVMSKERVKQIPT